MTSDTIVFYSFFSLDNDADCQDLGVLTKIRTEFFVSGKKQKGNLIKKVNEKIYNYFYSIEKDKPARWKKISEGKIYEKSRVNSDNTYSILYQNETKKLLKITTFDCNHNWLKTEYFNAKKKFIFEKLKNGLEILVSIYERGNKFCENYILYALNFSSISFNFINDIQILPKIFCMTNYGKIGYFDEKQIEKLKNLEIKKDNNEPEQLSLYNIYDTCDKNLAAICEEATNNIAQKLNKNFVSTNSLAEIRNIPQNIPNDLSQSSYNEEKNSMLNQQKNNLNSDEISSEHKIALNNELEQNNNLCEKNFVKIANIEGISSNFAENMHKFPTGEYFYFGETRQNMRQGLGRTTDMTGNTLYEGHYKDDMRDGFGVLYDNFSDFCYTGNFCANKKDGLGVTFDKLNNIAKISVWNNDKVGGFSVIFDKVGNIVILDKNDNIFLKINANCEQTQINNSKISQIAFVDNDEMKFIK